MATNVQPGPILDMSVGGGNKNAMNKPYDTKGERDWSNGLCSCFGSCGVCLGAFFCPCFIWAKNKSRLEHLSRNGTPHPSGGSGCDGPCCAYVWSSLCCLSWLLQVGTRGRIRKRYRIRGNGCGDCCAALCCATCQLTRESRELELEEKSMPSDKA